MTLTSHPRRLAAVVALVCAACALAVLMPSTAFGAQPVSVKGQLTSNGWAVPPGTTVQLWDAHGDLADTATTELNGRFFLYAELGDTGTLAVAALSQDIFPAATPLEWSGESELPFTMNVDPYPVAATGVLRDSTGEGLFNVKVIATPPHPGRGDTTVTTGVDGAFELRLPPDTDDYTVLVDEPGYVPKMVPLHYEGGAPQTLDISLVSQPLAFTGTVVDSVSNEPVYGSWVEWWPTGDRSRRRTVWCDAEGDFEIHAPAGTYDLRARGPVHGWWDATRVFGGFATVAVGDMPTPPCTCRITGTVTSQASGDPLPGTDLRIVVHDPGGGYRYQDTTQADDDGRYELWALPGVECDVIEEHPMMRYRHVAHVLTPMVDTEQDFVVETKLVLFNGTVIDGATAEPIPFANLMAETYSTTDGGIDFAITNEAGYYELCGDMSRIYELHVDAEGYRALNAVGYTFLRVPVNQDFIMGEAIPPVSTLTFAGGYVAPTWTRENVTFTLSADDGPKGVGVFNTYYALDHGALVRYAGSPVTITNEGVTDVDYLSADNLANIEATRTVTIRIDRTAPVTTSSTVAHYPSGASIGFMATDAVSGVRTTKWRLDGSVWQESATASVMGIGSHTIEFYSVDHAGNSETPKSASFTVGEATALTGASVSTTKPAKYGAKVAVKGVLHAGTATGSGVSGEKVSAQWAASTAGPWVDAGTGTSGASGAVSVSVTPRNAGYYRLSYTGKPGAFGSSASAVSAKVTPKAYVAKPSAKRLGERRYKLSGSLKPRHSKGSKPVRIYLWRKVGGRWKAAGSIAAKAADSGSNSVYSATHRFSKKGSWRLRAVHSADSGQAKSSSAYAYVKVR